MNKEALFKHAKKIAEIIKKVKEPVIVHHYDADGITSGAIIAKGFRQIGKDFEAVWVKQLYSNTLDELVSKGDFFIFVDFGSSHIDKLKERFASNFVVIDHHQPKTSKEELFLNCNHYGIDGASEASSSALAYIVSKNLGAKDIGALAIVGATGDMQESNGKLIGLNRDVLKEAIKEREIYVKKDLRLYGRYTRPLVQFLAYSTDPIIPYLTGSESNCARFLIERGFELKREGRWICYEDLSFEEKKKLASELAVHMISLNVPEWKIARLIGEVYILEKETEPYLKDAKEFATMMNACGRHNASEIGFKVALGDREFYYERALNLLLEHRKELREGIQLMIEEGIEERKNFYYFNAGARIKDSLIGIIAGMLYGSGAIMPNKPIIALANQEDGFVKVSARATRELVRRGLNLAKLMREVCETLNNGAEGGGHAIAAGARILPEHIERFLEILDNKIEEQLS